MNNVPNLWELVYTQINILSNLNRAYPAILRTSFEFNGLLPTSFIGTIIIPLIKYKTGNFGDKNDRSPLALACFHDFRGDYAE